MFAPHGRRPRTKLSAPQEWPSVGDARLVVAGLVHPGAPAASTMHHRRCLRDDPSMPLRALTSAEISLPAHPAAARVTERIAQLAQDVELVVLADNHAGQARMSPLAAVALAREQGVRTVVHISARIATG